MSGPAELPLAERLAQRRLQRVDHLPVLLLLFERQRERVGSGRASPARRSSTRARSSPTSSSLPDRPLRLREQVEHAAVAGLSCRTCCSRSERAAGLRLRRPPDSSADGQTGPQFDVLGVARDRPLVGAPRPPSSAALLVEIRRAARRTAAGPPTVDLEQRDRVVARPACW